MQTDRWTGYPSIDKPWLKFYEESAKQAKIPDCDLYDLLRLNHDVDSDDIMMEYVGRKISYRTFFDNVERLIISFKENGLNDGEVVTLMSIVTPETLYCIYALNHIGVIINSIFISMSEGEIVDTVKNTNSKYLIAIDSVAEKIKNIEERIEANIVLLSISESFPLFPKLLYGAKKKRIKFIYVRKLSDLYIERLKSSTSEIRIGVGNSKAIIMYTSGTTGIPKGVVLTNYAINSIAVQYAATMKFQKGDSFMGFIPPFFSIGFSLTTHMPLMLGLIYDICPNPDPEEVSKMYVKHKPNHFIGAPSNNMRIAELIKGDLSYIKTFATGGASCSLEQERSVNALLLANKAEAKFICGYGMTEFAGTVTTCRNDVYKEASIGIPLPLVNIKVVDCETREELGYNQVGELLFDSPGAFLEYDGMPEETEKIVSYDGEGTRWIRTGDLGLIDEEGFVFFKGRLKRIFLRKGTDGTLYKIFPQRIEELLIKNENVSEVAVVVEEDNTLLHIQTVYAVPVADCYSLDEVMSNLRQICERELPSHMVPDKFVSIENMPHRDNGKIDYVALAKIK